MRAKGLTIYRKEGKKKGRMEGKKDGRNEGNGKQRKKGILVHEERIFIRVMAI